MTAMMRKIVLALFLMPALMAQSAVEKRVLQSIREMMAKEGGRVTFSTLINNPSFSSDEKAFLGRLYENFFQVPGVLKSEFESTGKVPTRKDLADTFGITTASIDLLLAVMQSDRRVPPLFSVDSSTREIASLNMPNIEAFLEQRGAQVQVTQWEGKSLPEFELAKLEGGSIGSKSLDGPASLVYFWFTGCPPCGRISPHLAELDRKYGSKGFRIIGINADRVLELETTGEQRKKYLAKLGLQFPNAHLDSKTRAAFGGINIYPTLFFADSTGTIVHHFINYQDMQTLVGVVKGLLE